MARANAPVQVDGEDGGGEEALRHHVLEWGDHAVDGDAAEAHAEDAVETRGYERDARLLRGLRERLRAHIHSRNLYEMQSE